MNTEPARRSSIKIGMLPILVMVTSLCLSVLAVLALSTAHAASIISERQAQATAEGYAVESAAQRFVGDVDAVLAEVAGTPEAVEAEDEAEAEDTAEAGEGTTDDEAVAGETGAEAEAGADDEAVADATGDEPEAATDSTGAETEAVTNATGDEPEAAAPVVTSSANADEGTLAVQAALGTIIQDVSGIYEDVEVTAEVQGTQVVATFEGPTGRHLEITLQITDGCGYQVVRWNLTTSQADEGTGDVLWSGM